MTDAGKPMDPFLQLLRRWALSWLSCAEASTCEQILDPAYRILIGGHRIEGRDAYVQATLEQLGRFPGLGITVHQVLHGGDRVALRFTQHGAGGRDALGEVAWAGIAIFRWDGARLTECFAEEDYLSRRRQLRSGTVDPIEAPLAAPWSTAARAGEKRSEQVVRDWLKTGSLAGADCDDSWLGRKETAVEEPVLQDVELELDELFSAGEQVGFHGVWRGHYAGGLRELEGARGEPAALHFAGIATVHGGEVAAARVIRDRLGLARSLRNEGAVR